METCRVCGATLGDREELKHHNQVMHPNMPMTGGMTGMKGGEAGREKRAEKEAEKKPLT